MYVITALIGNSTTKIAVPRDKFDFIKTNLRTQAIHTASDAKDILSMTIKEMGIESAGSSCLVIASVVPSAGHLWKSAAIDLGFMKVLCVSKQIPLGIEIDYHGDNGPGADRICNAVAAFERFKGDTVVIDVGTAINIDCVDSQGRFLGGAIAPGPDTCARALTQYTGKLPLVSLAGFTGDPLGKDTKACIQSGILIGLAGLVDRVTREIKRSLGGKVRTVTCGGGASLILPYLRQHTEYIPDLTLEGAYLIGLKNAYDAK